VESVNGAEYYSYDPNGNLLTLENQASGLKKEYTADQLLTQKIYQNLVLNKEISYQYDTNGNLVKAVEAGTQGVTTNYVYNASNQLLKANHNCHRLLTSMVFQSNKEILS
jgi:YD repeat-containing protein